MGDAPLRSSSAARSSRRRLSTGSAGEEIRPGRNVTHRRRARRLRARKADAPTTRAAPAGWATGRTAVVDPACRVIGLEGLRVDRRLDHAEHRLRQSECAHHHDRREGRRHRAGQGSAAPFRRTRSPGPRLADPAALRSKPPVGDPSMCEHHRHATGVARGRSSSHWWGSSVPGRGCRRRGRSGELQGGALLGRRLDRHHGHHRA